MPNAQRSFSTRESICMQMSAIPEHVCSRVAWRSRSRLASSGLQDASAAIVHTSAANQPVWSVVWLHGQWW